MKFFSILITFAGELETDLAKKNNFNLKISNLIFENINYIQIVGPIHKCKTARLQLKFDQKFATCPS